MDTQPTHYSAIFWLTVTSFDLVLSFFKMCQTDWQSFSSADLWMYDSYTAAYNYNLLRHIPVQLKESISDFDVQFESH